MPADEDYTSIPRDAMDAADRGNVIEAIRIVCEETGLGLVEAKDAVEAYLQETQIVHSGSGSVEIPMDAVVALHQGKLIDAIRRTRDRSGIGLMQAKEAVEGYLASNPIVNQQFRAAAAERQSRMMRNIVALLLAGALLAGYLFFSTTGSQ
jgi:ribosomal protein L7/L12